MSNNTPDDPPLNVYVDRAKERFISAATKLNPPTPEQVEASRALAEAVIALAVVIDSHMPNSRNKSLALTALEDVQMRANRALYAKGPSA